MNELLRTVTPNELAQKCGLRAVDRDGSCIGNESEPAFWGIADAIRREVRRRSIATRRELRANIMPMLEAAGFSADAGASIRRVADEMVDIGELVDLRVDHQRGYAAWPSRWVRLGATSAAILGVSITDHLELEPAHDLQCVRRFNPQEADVVASLADQGVLEETFETWYGQPSWCNCMTADPMPQTLANLWAWQVREVENRGAEFAPNDTAIQAIAPTPGNFFQWPPKAASGRWTSPASLPEGVYLGAQPGHHERHWVPLMILLDSGIGRSLILESGSDNESHWELFCWLLVARGTEYPQREQIHVDYEGSTIKPSFPLPSQIQRCLKLCGESLGKWAFNVSDVAGAIDAISSRCDAVEWVQ